MNKKDIELICEAGTIIKVGRNNYVVDCGDWTIRVKCNCGQSNYTVYFKSIEVGQLNDSEQFSQKSVLSISESIKSIKRG